MFQRLSRMTSAVLLSVTVLIFPAIFDSGRGIDQQVQSDVQDDIDVLLKAYDAALQEELTHGATQQIADPSGGTTRILVGESQVKMDRLWAETLAKINALQARPETERASTVEMLHKVSGADPVYISRVGTPYNSTAELEEYEAGGFVYHVDITSGEIIKAWLKDQKDYSVEVLSSEQGLADMARAYVAKFSPGHALDSLALVVLNKDSEIYFFRWEDSAGQLADGTIPFIQIALSRSGDLLNFENTLPLSRRSADSNLPQLLTVKPVLAIGDNQVYSNGGAQWGWERQDAAYTTQGNAGYCYTQGSWCTPKHFYWAASPSGDNTYYGSLHRGKWTATSFMRYRNTRTSAYIPCTNATAKVFYYKWYNGGSSSVSNYVDQQIWCNTWVEMSSTLYDIQRVVLANTNEAGTGKKIAWDEIWDYVP